MSSATGKNPKDASVSSRDSAPEANVSGSKAGTVVQTLEERESDEKAARLLLYRLDDVRRLVGWILKGHDEIRPKRSRETGQFVYSGIEFGLGDISTLLAQLESQRILLRTMSDTAPCCPACQKSNFHVEYVCPYSQHTTLEHGTMIEHYPCGNADFENAYRSGASELVCPKCRRTLKVIGTDYRKIERAYRCTGCRKTFGTPKITLECRVCDKKNDEEELVMTPVYSYRVNEQLRSELIAHCSLEANVISCFEKAGFKVTTPKRMQGLSGVFHNFDLGAEKQRSLIVLDMVSAMDEVGPKDVIEFFAKVYDAKPPKALLIALPRLNVEAQRLGAMYGVDIIGAASPDEAVSKLSNVVGLQPSSPIPEPEIGTKVAAGQVPEISGPESIDRLQLNQVTKGRVASETRVKSFIDDAVSMLEKSRTEPVKDASVVATQPQVPPPPQVKQQEETKPPEELSTDAQDVLRQARERMKHLIKETED